MQHCKVVAAVLAALAFSGAGCGGGGAPSATRADFTEQAEAVCKRARKQMTVIARPGARDTERMVELVGNALAYQRTAIADLAEIDAPAASAGRFDGYLAALRRENALAERILDVAEPGADGFVRAGTPEAAVAKRRDAVAREAVQLAKALGLKECRA